MEFSANLQQNPHQEKLIRRDNEHNTYPNVRDTREVRRVTVGEEPRWQYLNDDGIWKPFNEGAENVVESKFQIWLARLRQEIEEEGGANNVIIRVCGFILPLSSHSDVSYSSTGFFRQQLNVLTFKRDGKHEQLNIKTGKKRRVRRVGGDDAVISRNPDLAIRNAITSNARMNNLPRAAQHEQPAAAARNSAEQQYMQSLRKTCAYQKITSDLFRMRSEAARVRGEAKIRAGGYDQQLRSLMERQEARLRGSLPRRRNLPAISAPTPALSGHQCQQPLFRGSHLYYTPAPAPFAPGNSAAAASGSTINRHAESKAASRPEPPQDLLCPILHELFEDPVSTADGHTYERSAIERWLMTKNTSPVTGTVLEHKKLIPNHVVRGMARDFAERAS